jgi:hypothetical protein
MKTEYMRAGGGQSVCTAQDNTTDACTCEANRANVNTNYVYIKTVVYSFYEIYVGL